VKMLSSADLISSRRFIEVGCGSGAICISLLKQLPLVSLHIISSTVDTVDLFVHCSVKIHYS